jgi:hypothetical protein
MPLPFGIFNLKFFEETSFVSINLYLKKKIILEFSVNESKLKLAYQFFLILIYAQSKEVFFIKKSKGFLVSLNVLPTLRFFILKLESLVLTNLTLLLFIPIS